MAKIQELVNTLNYHTDLYDAGKPEISDKEWDNLYFELQRLEKESEIYFSDSPTQSVHYSFNGFLEEVEHTHPMRSLDKTKDLSDIKGFAKKHKLIGMGKMDGLTCALRYEDGVLVRAETRGKTYKGYNVLEHIKGIKNVPKKINKMGVLEVDGEVICRYVDFEKFAKMGYKSARNFAAGSLGLDDPMECCKRNLTFVAWDYINNPYDTLGEALCELSKLNFTTVPRIDGIDLELDNLEEIVDDLKKFCEEDSYPIDGLVFKYDNVDEYNAAGYVEHHAKGGLAFKFYDEEYESELTGIEYDVGRTGTLTPVALFKDVDIDGVTINRASLSNMSVMHDTFGTYTPKVGTTVYVTRRNGVIPHIERAEGDGENSICEVPEKCPLCGGEVGIVMTDDAERLMCLNADCEGKLAVRIAHYCDMTKGMKIKGISRATIEKLVEWGWLNSIKDLYTLKEHRMEWANKPGFGLKSVDKVLVAIEASKSCDLWQFISAIGIPLIGVTASRDLEAKFRDWATFYKSIQENFNIYTIPNFGEEMDKSIHSFDFSEANEIATNYLAFNKVEDKGDALEGITVCITGKLVQYKNRANFQKDIEAVGGKVSSSVSANTNYLITNDPTSGSAKNKSAQKLGVEIVTEEEFISKFLKN